MWGLDPCHTWLISSCHRDGFRNQAGPHVSPGTSQSESKESLGMVRMCWLYHNQQPSTRDSIFGPRMGALWGQHLQVGAGVHS